MVYVSTFDIASFLHSPDLGFSMVRMMVVPYFLAALERMETTRYVLRGSRSQVGSSSSRITTEKRFKYLLLQKGDMYKD